MSTKIDDPTRAALCRVATENRFVAWLEEQNAATSKVLRVADGQALYKAQGKAIFIDELLDLLSKLKNS